MANFKELTVWIIILNFFIMIGAGHGIAPIGLFEISGILQGFGINTEYFSLSLTASYDKSISAAALFSLIGQLSLTFSISIKNRKRIFWFKILGLFFLWTGFYYISHNLSTDNASELGFIFGIPFLICSVILFYKVILNKNSYLLNE